MVPGVERHDSPSDVVGFVRARRYETFSVHQLLQGYKCNDCSWLGAGPNGGKVSVDEARKRMDLTQELVYWFFDSFLVPLLKVSYTKL
jgi:telomerase reverse transcriptase